MTNGKMLKRVSVLCRGELISACLLGATLLWALMLSSEGAEYVKDGMRLAVGSVIPSSFPFMVITDFYVAYGRPENLRLIGAVLSRLMGIPPAGLGALICGNVGGFPIGAKACADAYASGALERSDAQRLIPLCNNPSCAFIVGGVGIGMWGEARIGVTLLISVISATLLCGVITKSKQYNNAYTDNNIRQNYSFVESVKKAGVSSISIISFVCLFSVLCGIIKKRVKNALLIYPLFSILEVTNAVSSLASSDALPEALRLSACAFALGFGGVCVGMQSSSFVRASGLTMKNYYRVKLLEGMLAAAVFSLLYHI